MGYWSHGQQVVRPNPYGDGFVISRMCNTIKQYCDLYWCRYDPRFRMGFPERLLVFDSVDEAKEYRFKGKELFA